LLKITGVIKDSDAAKTNFDGEDFSEVLLGQKINQPRQTPIFWRRPPDHSGTDSEPLPDLALRKGKWKFLMQFDGSRQQLYDLEKDVTESINLAESEPELVNKLTQTLLDWNHSLPKDAGEKVQK
jgi:uncharacterized sulfatase